MRKSAIYLVESAKGLVSIWDPPIKGEIIVIVLLGRMCAFNYPFPKPNNVVYCSSSSSSDILNCKRLLESAVSGTQATFVATDDTFNVISYSIVRACADFCLELVLFDHLKAAGLTYRLAHKLRCYIRFRRLFFKFPHAFVPVVFSNGVCGYKLRQSFSRIEYFDDRRICSKQLIVGDFEVLILFPLLVDWNSKCFVDYANKLLTRIAEQHVFGFSAVAVKMHPRATEEDKSYLASCSHLSRCQQLDASIPLELFDLAGKLILNFQSSFSLQNGSEVLLFASHFGYDEIKSSNMTGSEDFSLDRVESLLLSKLSLPRHSRKNGDEETEARMHL